MKVLPKAIDLVGFLECDECGYGGYLPAHKAHEIDKAMYEKDQIILKLYDYLHDIGLALDQADLLNGRAADIIKKADSEYEQLYADIAEIKDIINGRA